MEQKRRTIHTNGKKRKGKKTLLIICIILGLALIFFVSYKIAYGIFSNDTPLGVGQTDTEEDISSMPRGELEEKYTEQKKALAEKDTEIKRLEELLSKKENESVPEDTGNEEKQPENTPEDTPDTQTPTQKPTEAEPSAGSTHEGSHTTTPDNGNHEEVTPPAPAESMPEGGLISPEDLEKAAEAANQ